MSIRVAAFVLLLSAGVTSASAQSHALDQGSVILDGSAGISSVGVGDGDRLTTATVAPRVQYFVRPGLAVGGRALLYYFSSDGESTTSVGAGPELTYYFGPAEQVLHPFVSANTSVGRQGGGTTYGYEVSAGLLRMISRTVGLNGRLYYQAFDSTSNYDTFGLALGFSAFTF